MGSRKLSVDKKWGEGGKPRLQENGEKAAKERRRRMESLVESAGKKSASRGRVFLSSLVGEVGMPQSQECPVKDDDSITRLLFVVVLPVPCSLAGS